MYHTKYFNLWDHEINIKYSYFKRLKKILKYYSIVLENSEVHPFNFTEEQLFLDYWDVEHFAGLKDDTDIQLVKMWQNKLKDL
jgi:hypothetical protein